ncbi:MAG: cytochrome c-type biogenesis protein CcmH [Burkholderiales bacterium]|nr:cytochrome c-type biogenesis protein CcmH [Burkholderiales bacterium]MBH2014951.1 cytochrome c-type biogenesis protein CcmH [Burkholderiales bacterium]
MVWVLVGAWGGPWGVAQANTAPPSGPELEARTNRLAAELRCLVCQNQTIADSQVELAVQLKREVREQLARGESEAAVRDFMVQRYGDFVLYRPPWREGTLALWLGPLFLLLAGLGGLLWHLRERARGLGAPDSLNNPDSAFDSAWPDDTDGQPLPPRTSTGPKP